MIGDILKSTSIEKSPRRTCRQSTCRRPQVLVDKSKRLPVPITVTYAEPKEKSAKSIPTTVQFIETSGRWETRQRLSFDESQKKEKNGILCRWYKRRKALKERNKEIEYQKKYENRLRQLLELEESRQRAQSLPPPEEKKWVVTQQRHRSLPPTRKNKFVRIKEKSAYAKPTAQSKYVPAKKLKKTESRANKCANCFYRACCKCYCYLNCIILFIIIVVLVL